MDPQKASVRITHIAPQQNGSTLIGFAVKPDGTQDELLQTAQVPANHSKEVRTLFSDLYNRCSEQGWLQEIPNQERKQPYRAAA